MSVISANTAITHTYGNVACVAINYIKQYFSDTFFQTEHISTKMTYKQLDVFRAKREFWKNRKPMLIIKPRIEMDDSSKALYGSLMMNRITNSKLRAEFTDTVPVIVDHEFGTMLRFAWTRHKIYFDVAIVLETYNQQINIAHALMNNMVPLTPMYIKTTLEACVPRGIIYPMQHHLGIKHCDTAETLNYMNTFGQTPFTYKLKDSSGNDEYFMLYDTNIETILSEISIDDGERRGKIADTYTINLAMSMEFNAVGTWYAFLKDANPNFIVNPTDVEISADISGGKDDERIVPLLSLPLRYDLHLTEGWKILQSPTYQVTESGIGVGHKDVTPFGYIITDDIKRSLQSIINHNRDNGIPLSPYIQFRLFKGTRELSVGKNGYEIDLDKWEIHTYDCSPKTTYRLFILVNNLAIQSISEQVRESQREK